MPVLRSVAAILVPIIPDLPMPETKTCPRHDAIVSTALAKAGVIFSRTDLNASISMSRTRAISSRMFMSEAVCSLEI